MADVSLPCREYASPDLIRRARELYQNDDCEIDENAAVSSADDGDWVAAWVWVPRDDGS